MPKLQVSISEPSSEAVVSLKRGRAELEISATELEFLANLNTILSTIEQDETNEPTEQSTTTDTEVSVSSAITA